MDLAYIDRNIRTIIARAYVRIVAANRELSWLFFESVLPLLTVAAYVYIYKSFNAGSDLIGFVILGGAMTAYWMHIIYGMALQFFWEKEMGNLDLYLTAPISRMAILLGMAIGGAFATTIRAVSTIVMGIIIFRVQFLILDPWRLVAVFLITMGALYFLGMMSASLFMVWGRAAVRTSELFHEPVFLISGFYFPVKTLGFTVSTIASLLPMTLGLDALRQLLLQGGLKFGIWSVDVEIAALTLLTLLFYLLSSIFLRKVEEYGKREGTITLRWL